MAEYPNPSDAAGSFDSENYQDYAGALQTVRAARSIFLLLLVLSVLSHIGIYCAARWTQVLTTTETVQEEIESPADDAAPGTIDLEEPVQQSARVYYLVKMALPLTEFIGQVSCGALLLCYLMATNIALSGRLGGVRGSIASFFWMVILMALLFPWDRWLGDLRDQVQIPGAFLTFAEISDLPAEFSSRLTEVLHYVRFLGYPFMVFLIAVVGDRRCAKGLRLAQRQVEAHLNVRSG